MNESTQLKKAKALGRVTAMLGVLRINDEEAYIHSIEVASIVDEYISLAKKIGECEWTDEECEFILTGALLHDIGKAFLPFNLQHSSTNLTKYEREVINMHPILGVISTKNCQFSDIVQNIILMHHANADGSGYPAINNERLNEKNVPEYVWLISYADRFEAMTNDRAFKSAMNYPEAWKEILSLSSIGSLPYKFTRLFGELVKEYSIIRMNES